MTLVTIGVPVFNGAAFVAETIRSALAQTHEDIELIVADDGSSDDSMDVVKGFTDSRIRIIEPSGVGGAANNWNRLVDEARGEWIKILCQDDLVYSQCLSQQLSVGSSSPDITIVGSRRDIILPSGRVLFHSRGIGSLCGVVAGQEAIRSTVRSGGNLLGEPSVVLLHTDALRAAGRFSVRHRYTVDLECWFRLLRRGSLGVTEATLAAFRVSPAQWSAQLARDQKRACTELFDEQARDDTVPVTAADARLGSIRAATQARGRSAIYTALRRLA